MSQTVSMTVNGRAVSVTVDDPEMPLLYALRDDLGLTGRASAAASANAAPARCMSTARRCAPA